MKIRTIAVASVMMLSFAGYGVAQEMGGMMSPLMPAEKVESEKDDDGDEARHP